MSVHSEARLEICAECKRGGYDHRRIGLLVDGRLYSEISLCRRCAVPRIDDAARLLERGHEHASRD